MCRHHPERDYRVQKNLIFNVTLPNANVHKLLPRGIAKIVRINKIIIMLLNVAQLLAQIDCFVLYQQMLFMQAELPQRSSLLTIHNNVHDLLTFFAQIKQ